jgi:hypothetical protein
MVENVMSAFSLPSEAIFNQIKASAVEPFISFLAYAMDHPTSYAFNSRVCLSTMTEHPSKKRVQDSEAEMHPVGTFVPFRQQILPYYLHLRSGVTLVLT